MRIGVSPIAIALCATLRMGAGAATLDDYVRQFREEEASLGLSADEATASLDFLRENVPVFECPDKEIERTYYYRWWTFCRHIRPTPDGRVITEFAGDRQLNWAGPYNTITCAAGHHLMEARWLKDSKVSDEYARFLFAKGIVSGEKAYVSWLAHALWESAKVTGNARLLTDLLDAFVRNYENWERGWPRLPWPLPADGKPFPMGLKDNGLFATTDDREGSEYSVGGDGFRPLVNAAMCAEASAIARIAVLAGRQDVAQAFSDRAQRLERRMRELLWNPEREFYTVRDLSGRQKPSRELFGYAPWYFRIAGDDSGAAWRFLMRTDGFFAPCGLTDVERSDPKFAIDYRDESKSACRHDGPSWPYAESLVLTALANALQDGRRTVGVTRADYAVLLHQYAAGHRLELPGGRRVSWIDENRDPFTGEWIARRIIELRKDRGRMGRGRFYNHSTFCDLVLSGLCGIRPEMDGRIALRPLAPVEWDHFRVANLKVRGHEIEVVWDRTGQCFGRGQGLHLFVDAKETDFQSNTNNERKE